MGRTAMRIGRQSMRALRPMLWKTASVGRAVRKALGAGLAEAQAQQQQQPPAQTSSSPPAQAGAANAGPVQPGGCRHCRPGVGPVEKFADLGGTPQGRFLEGGAFDNDGNLWFVAIGSGWVAYLHPTAKFTPAFNCNPPDDIGQTCEPQGTRWHDGKLYVPTRHRGILTYDPKTKEVKTLVYTYRNQLFKGPNDLDFDAEGNLFFTDPWATGVGPNLTDQSGAVYQYSKDGVLRKVMDSLHFPNGIAVSPDNGRWRWRLHGKPDGLWLFATGPTLSNPGSNARPAAPDLPDGPGRHLSSRRRMPGRPPLRRPKAISGSPRGGLGGNLRGRSARRHYRLRADPERRSLDHQLCVRRP